MEFADKSYLSFISILLRPIYSLKYSLIIFLYKILPIEIDKLHHKTHSVHAATHTHNQNYTRPVTLNSVICGKVVKVLVVYRASVSWLSDPGSKLTRDIIMLCIFQLSLLSGAENKQWMTVYVVKT